MNQAVLRNRFVKGGLAFLLWTLIGFAFAGQLYLSGVRSGRSVSWSQAVGSSLGDWYVWAVLSLPIVQLARRFRFDSPNWGFSVTFHLLASAAFSLIYMVVRALVGQVQGRLAGTPITFAEAFPLLFKTFLLNLLIYWVIVSIAHAFDYYRQVREREVRAVELEKRLTEAKLEALQMQLNPHFLFNTLYAISALMHKDVEAADRMIARLSDLLRYALESTTEQEVSLRQELDFLRRYLEIEQTRFGERLRVEMDIAPDTLDVRVPNLILQPVVENAIQHGIEPHSRPGVLRISSRREDGALRVVIRDNGNGLAGGQLSREGVGLSNTRSRLKQLYGDRHRFEFDNAEGGGLTVQLVIPLRAATRS
jgi:signal transduction histidine kinase